LATITSGAMPIHSGASLLQRFQQVRSTTLRLADPLSAEDAMVQSMPDASPAKWHLAHTTWFFETFILTEQLAGYRIFNPEYRLLFNSYYKTLGSHPVRQQRGTFSRPSLSNVLRYREHVDEAMQRLLSHQLPPQTLAFVLLGIHHEQQHQELLLTDILHAFWSQPLRPAYAPPAEEEDSPSAAPLRWIPHPGGTAEIGAPADGFAFDNERPRHAVLLSPYQLASRLVTKAEYLDFMNDKGYQRPELWLSDGWDTVCREGWQAPMYWEKKPWEKKDGEKKSEGWSEFSLRGMNPLNLAAPVSHISYYEADAFARWSGARLPLEGEWEQAARDRTVAGNLLEGWTLEARPAQTNASTQEPQPEEEQLFGDLWEWTASAYLAYPGFRPEPGAVGEYNGKFMCNQFVLRGGSFATSASHIRAPYRNFFPPHVRWQFMGIRLANHER
jgi:ergothioneine biosynthesis protein EgtB